MTECIKRPSQKNKEPKDKPPKRHDSSVIIESTSSDSSSSESNEFAETILQEGRLDVAMYALQAGGHSKIFTIANNMRLLKPKNPHEDAVYKKLQTTTLKCFAPPYYGSILDDSLFMSEGSYRQFQQRGEWLVLVNLTAKYKHPCVIDVKLGHKRYLPGLDPLEKMYTRKVKSTATTASTLGFRISGMRVYQPFTGSYVIRRGIRRNRLISDKNGSLMKMLSLFIHNGIQYRVDLIHKFLIKLQALHTAMSAEASTFDFRASSVLLCYEGDISVQEVIEPSVDVRLIDFDHTTIKEEPNDEDTSGALFGVGHLISFFRKLLLLIRRSTELCLKPSGVVDKSDRNDGPSRRNSTPLARSKVLPLITANDRMEILNQ